MEGGGILMGMAVNMMYCYFYLDVSSNMSHRLPSFFTFTSPEPSDRGSSLSQLRGTHVSGAESADFCAH
jgi:hypothetical protein